MGPDQAVGADLADHQAHLVAVGGHHHPEGVGRLGALDGKERAVVVADNLVGYVLIIVCQQAADLPLLTGDADGLGEGLHQ